MSFIAIAWALVLGAQTDVIDLSQNTANFGEAHEKVLSKMVEFNTRAERNPNWLLPGAALDCVKFCHILLTVSRYVPLFYIQPAKFRHSPISLVTSSLNRKCSTKHIPTEVTREVTRQDNWSSNRSNWPLTVRLLKILANIKKKLTWILKILTGALEKNREAFSRLTTWTVLNSIVFRYIFCTEIHIFLTRPSKFRQTPL